MAFRFLGFIPFSDTVIEADMARGAGEAGKGLSLADSSVTDAVDDIARRLAGSGGAS